MRHRRWATALVAVLALAVPAICNPLILAPTATTLTTGQVRAEAALSSGNNNGRYYWLGTGLQQYEMNAIGFQQRGEQIEGMVGVQASFLPETSLSPAIAFGVNDLASQSSDGIGLYAVVTRHLPVGAASIFVKDFAATVGVGVLGIKGPFSGFEAKLPGNLFVQGEWDSHDLNAAVGWQPTSLFRVKAYSIRGDTYYGAELVPMTF
jgi:hypothetical protein